MSLEGRDFSVARIRFRCCVAHPGRPGRPAGWASLGGPPTRRPGAAVRSGVVPLGRSVGHLQPLRCCLNWHHCGGAVLCSDANPFRRRELPAARQPRPRSAPARATTRCLNRQLWRRRMAAGLPGDSPLRSALARSCSGDGAVRTEALVSVSCSAARTARESWGLPHAATTSSPSR